MPDTPNPHDPFDFDSLDLSNLDVEGADEEPEEEDEWDFGEIEDLVKIPPRVAKPAKVTKPAPEPLPPMIIPSHVSVGPDGFTADDLAALPIIPVIGIEASSEYCMAMIRSTKDDFDRDGQAFQHCVLRYKHPQSSDAIVTFKRRTAVALSRIRRLAKDQGYPVPEFVMAIIEYWPINPDEHGKSQFWLLSVGRMTRSIYRHFLGQTNSSMASSVSTEKFKDLF